MTHVVTYIDIEPGSTDRAVALIKRYGGRGGVLLQETCRPNRFVIAQKWDDESPFQADERAERIAHFRSNLRAIHNSPYDQRVHNAFAVSNAPRTAPPNAMYVVTHVDVPPPRREETEILLKTLAEQSRSDEGNVQYDVFQQLAPRTNHFTIFAVWNDEKAFAAHEMKPHTRQFREALGPMLGAPYDERLYQEIR